MSEQQNQIEPTNIVDRLEQRILEETTPRFTIRELLLVTLLIGAVCAWWMEHRRANALNLERIIRGDVERELQAYKDRADANRELLNEYRRQGYHSLHAPDGTVTIVYEDPAITKARRERHAAGQRD
jgi:hypothetical protein